jgi:hypothetical protein
MASASPWKKPSAVMRSTITRAARLCTSKYFTPGRTASSAANCIASTVSYSSRWRGVNQPPTGSVRVMSLA